MKVKFSDRFSATRLLLLVATTAMLWILGFTSAKNYEVKGAERGQFWQSSDMSGGICGQNWPGSETLQLCSGSRRDGVDRKHWFCYAMTRVRFVVSVTLGFENTTQSLSRSTTAFVSMSGIDFGSERCNNKQIGRQVDLLDTISSNDAVHLCDKVRQGTEETFFRTFYCYRPAQRIIFRSSSFFGRLVFTSMAYKDDEDDNEDSLYSATRLLKNNTMRTWQSSAAGDTCWHLSQEKTLSIRAGTKDYLRTGGGLSADMGFHWFAAWLMEPTLVESFTLLNNPSAATSNLELWVSSAAVDFGSDGCTTSGFQETLDRLQRSASPSLFTLCQRRERIEANERTDVTCRRWVLTLLIRVPCGKSDQPLILQSIWIKHWLAQSEESLDIRRHSSSNFSSFHQTSSSGANGCLHRSFTSSVSSSSSLETRSYLAAFSAAAAAASSQHHWLTVTLTETLPVRYVTVAASDNSSVLSWSSSSIVNFGAANSDPCDSREIPKIFRQNSAQFRACQEIPFKISRLNYMVCNTWTRTLAVRITPLPGNAVKVKNVALLPATNRPDFLSVLNSTHNSVTLALSPPHLSPPPSPPPPPSPSPLLLRCPNQAERLLEGDEATSGIVECRGLRSAVEQEIQIVGTQPVIDSNSSGGQQFIQEQLYAVAKTRVAPVANFGLASVTMTCVNVSWTPAANSNVGHRITCPAGAELESVANSWASCCRSPTLPVGRVRVSAWRPGFVESDAVEIEAAPQLPTPVAFLISANSTCAEFAWGLSVSLNFVLNYTVECPVGLAQRMIVQPVGATSAAAASCCGRAAAKNASRQAATIHASAIGFLASRTEIEFVNTEERKDNPLVNWSSATTFCLVGGVGIGATAECAFGSSPVPLADSKSAPANCCCYSGANESVGAMLIEEKPGGSKWHALIERPLARAANLRLVNQTGDSCAALAWDVASDPSVFYTVECPSQFAVEFFTPGVVRCCELGEGVEARVTVVARRAVANEEEEEEEEESASVSFRTRLLKPINFRVTKCNSSCCYLSWSPSFNPSVFYRLQCPSGSSSSSSSSSSPPPIIRRVAAGVCCSVQSPASSSLGTATLVATLGDSEESDSATLEIVMRQGAQLLSTKESFFSGNTIAIVIVVILAVKLGVIGLLCAFR